MLYRLPRALALSALALAASTFADPIDDLIQREIETKRIPGAAVLILKDDQVVKRTAYGLADVEQQVKMMPEAVFESGSIGKTFTATVIMQLVEEGKLSLDDPIAKHLGDKVPEKWRANTVRHLLAHQSGIPEYALVPSLGLVETWTLDDWWKKMTELPMDFAVGARFAYSNSNYLLLGLIAQAVAGEDINVLRTKRILEKLELKNSLVEDARRIVPNRIPGYLLLPNGIARGMAIPHVYGDGSLLNSLEDLATFEKAFREGRLVKPETRDLMQTAQRTTNGRKTGYGLGWMVREVNGVPTISHGGNTGAFSNSLFTVPSEKLTIVLTMNVHNQSGDGLAQRIAEHYAPALAPIAYKESPDPDPARTEKLLKSVKALAAGELASADLDPDYLERLQTARGRMGLGALARFRTVESMAFLNQEKADPDTLLRYRTKVDGKSVLLTLVVTSEGRLFQVGFRDEG